MRKCSTWLPLLDGSFFLACQQGHGMSYLVLRMRAIPFLPVSRSTMLRKSLRVQILSLLGGSLVAMLLIALVCFQFLSSSVRGYAELVDGPLRASQLI
ncbi:hypothetical protein C9975_06485, partial [Thalassospira xiamenensis]